MRNRKFGFGVVLALVAVLVAAAVATGAASSAVGYVITSSSQIKDGVIGTKDLSPAAREALQGDRGARGAPGKDGVGTPGVDGKNGKDSTVPGPQGNAGGTGPAGTDCSGQAPASPARTCPGATGATGAAGDSYLKGAYWSIAYYDVGDTNGGAIATVACSAETDTAIEGGASTDDITKVVPLGQTFPGRMDWSTNTPKPGRLDGWIVQFASQNGSSPLRVKVWALCVPNLSIPVVQTYQQSVDG